RVLHQRGNGHRPDTTGYRRDPAALVLHRLEVDVAGQTETLVARTVGHAGGTDVDDHRALLDHVGADELGFAHGDEQDVGGAADFLHVLRVAVHQRDGAVAGLAVARHQHGHRRADDVAAPHHHAVLTGGFDAIALEQLHDAIGRGGDEGG